MFYRPFVPSLCLALVILGLYSIPGTEIGSLSFWDLLAADKIAHTGIFTVFTLSLIAAFRRQTRYSGLRARYKTVAIGLSMTYGAALELLQAQVFVDRSGDVLDFIANGLGAFLGLILFRIIYGYELSK